MNDQDENLAHELKALLAVRRGHFKLESGHHGNLWLDLDQLFRQPRRIHPMISKLAERIAKYNISAVCGPLVGGALIAQTVADELGIEFYYTERREAAVQAGLFPVEYQLPEGLRKSIAGKSVAILDDVINAGSAVRGTLASLQKHGASPSVIGALLVLGDAAPDHFSKRGIPLEQVAHIDNQLWEPAECPLCADNVPLTDLIP